RILLSGKEVAKLRIKSVPPPADPDGPVRDRGVEGTVQLPETISQPVMKLTFELTDTEGITNPRGASYDLRVIPDAAPTVTVKRRSVRGSVTARARIPLSIQVSDDYGVATVAVAAGAVVRGATQPATKNFGVPGVTAGATTARLDYALDLAPMGLKIGQLLRVHVEARDTLPESFGGPNVGLSILQTFKIVSEADILAELAAVQGPAADLGGYYRTDEAKTDAVMRPSKTLNSIIG
ncbi:hypothetical protein LCGC14_2606150, partial [marine sediment metagenome]